jgi:signal transduction histidine kinase
MQADKLVERYRELQRYIDWTDEDALRVRKLAPIAQQHFAALIDDFYAAIQRNSATAKIITGGAQQIERLKGTLMKWLEELFSGKYDEEYVLRRGRICLRHVEIGLEQVYTSVAVARLRGGLLRALETELTTSEPEMLAARRSLNKLLDLDLTIIQEAYQTEFFAWQNREQREKLLQSERLAAIGETMAGLVHESRNALQRSRACLEMLAVDIGDRPPALGLVRRIQRAQDDLHRLFEEVREYAAPISLRQNHCDLSEIWRQAWNELAHLHLEKNLVLVESIDQKSIHGNVDRFALGQVFRNLLENAIQASPSEGKIAIAAKHTADSDRTAWQITIHDQGSGIPAENRTHILKPFFTTKAKGTGLGLAIAARIIEGHGGRIEIGEPAAGTLVYVYLPQGEP